MKLDKFVAAIDQNDQDKLRDLLGTGKTANKALTRRIAGGKTLIHYASERNQLSILATLVELATPEQVDALDDRKWTALHIAANEGHLKACVLLLQAGADATRPTSSDNTFLHYFTRIAFDDNPAYMPHFDQISKLLLEKGVNVNVFNNRGETPLHGAALRGRLLACKFLLKANAIPDLTTKDGESAVHFAARGGHATTLKLLLDAGADPTVKGNFGTAADVALASNQEQCLQLLQEETDHENLKVKMKRIVEHPELCIVFFNFLAKSFSEENLSFYLAAEDFREMWSGADRNAAIETGHRLYERYVKEGSLHEINIDHGVRKAVDPDNLNQDSFRECEEFVFKLMAYDLLRKFLASEFYKSFTSGKMARPSPTKQRQELWDDVQSHFKGRLKWLDSQDELNQQRLERQRLSEGPSKVNLQDLRSSGSFSGVVPKERRKSRAKTSAGGRLARMSSDDEGEMYSKMKKSSSWMKQMRSRSPGASPTSSPEISPRRRSRRHHSGSPSCVPSEKTQFRNVLDLIGVGDESGSTLHAYNLESISDVEIQELLEALATQNSNFSFLDMSRNGINDGQAVLLLRGLRDVPTVTSLDLSYNNITNDGAAMMRIVMGEIGTNLSTLALTGNAVHPRLVSHLEAFLEENIRKAPLQDSLASDRVWTTDIEYLTDQLRRRRLDISRDQSKTPLKMLQFVEESVSGMFDVLNKKLDQLEMMSGLQGVARYHIHRQIENRIYLVTDGMETRLIVEISRRAEARRLLSPPQKVSVHSTPERIDPSSHMLLACMMPISQVRDIMRVLCCAVEDMHSHGFVHGCLHPGCILGDHGPNGEFITPRICDFHYISLPVREFKRLPVAPEVINESTYAPKPKPAADVYGLGIILFVMLTLQENPFGAEDALVKQREGRPRVAPALDKALRNSAYAELYEFSLDCLNSNPNARPPLTAMMAMMVPRHGDC